MNEDFIFSTIDENYLILFFIPILVGFLAFIIIDYIISYKINNKQPLYNMYKGKTCTTCNTKIEYVYERLMNKPNQIKYFKKCNCPIKCPCGDVAKISLYPTHNDMYVLYCSKCSKREIAIKLYKIE